MPDTLRRPTASLAARPSSRRRRRDDARPLDGAAVAALRDLLAPPDESEDEAERTVARIMAHIHAAAGVERAG